jgi:hypothetical protein
VAIESAYNFKITVNAVDLSDHCISLKVNMPQQANEAQAAGDTHKKYRAGPGDPSIEATFRADHSTGGVNQTLSGLVLITSTGVPVVARVKNTTRTSANPDYSAEMILSGDLTPMDHNWGEVPTITAKFVPYGTFSILTSAS